MTPFEAAFADSMQRPSWTNPDKMNPENPSAKERASRFLQTRTRMIERFKEVQETQAKYYNQHRKDAPIFMEGDQVWLNTANIDTRRPIKKLSDKKLKVTVVKQVGPLSYKLKLPDHLRIHDVFHVSLLDKVHPDPFDRPGPAPHPSISIQEPEEWLIDDLIERKWVDGEWKYHVHYKGYDDRYDEWLPARDISQNALLRFFKHQIDDNHASRGRLPQKRGRKPLAPTNMEQKKSKPTCYGCENQEQGHSACKRTQNLPSNQVSVTTAVEAILEQPLQSNPGKTQTNNPKPDTSTHTKRVRGRPKGSRNKSHGKVEKRTLRHHSRQEEL
jgi:hypothetical protein